MMPAKLHRDRDLPNQVLAHLREKHFIYTMIPDVDPCALMAAVCVSFDARGDMEPSATFDAIDHGRIVSVWWRDWEKVALAKTGLVTGST